MNMVHYNAFDNPLLEGKIGTATYIPTFSYVLAITSEEWIEDDALFMRRQISGILKELGMEAWEAGKNSFAVASRSS